MAQKSTRAVGVLTTTVDHNTGDFIEKMSDTARQSLPWCRQQSGWSPLLAMGHLQRGRFSPVACFGIVRAVGPWR